MSSTIAFKLQSILSSLPIPAGNQQIIASELFDTAQDILSRCKPDTVTNLVTLDHGIVPNTTTCALNQIKHLDVSSLKQQIRTAQSAPTPTNSARSVLFPEFLSLHDLNTLTTTTTTNALLRPSRTTFTPSNSNITWILTSSAIVGVDIASLLESEYTNVYSAVSVVPVYTSTALSYVNKDDKVNLSLYNNIVINDSSTLAIIWSSIPNACVAPLIIDLPAELPQLDAAVLLESFEDDDKNTSTMIPTLKTPSIILNFGTTDFSDVIRDVQFHALSSHTLLVLSDTMLTTYTLFYNQYVYTQPPAYLIDMNSTLASSAQSEQFLTAPPTTIYHLNSLPTTTRQNNNETQSLDEQWVKMVYIPATTNTNTLSTSNPLFFPQFSFSYGLLSQSGIFAVLSPIIPHMFICPTVDVLCYRQYILINTFPQLYQKITESPLYQQLIQKLPPAYLNRHNAFLGKCNDAIHHIVSKTQSDQSEWLAFLLHFDTIFGLHPKNPFIETSVASFLTQFKTESFHNVQFGTQFGDALHCDSFDLLFAHLTVDVPSADSLMTDVFTKLASVDSNTAPRPVLQIYGTIIDAINTSPSPQFYDCTLIPNKFNVPILATTAMTFHGTAQSAKKYGPSTHTISTSTVTYTIIRTSVNSTTTFLPIPTLLPVGGYLSYDHSYHQYSTKYGPIIASALKSELNTTDSRHQAHLTRISRLTAPFSTQTPAAIDTNPNLYAKTIVFTSNNAQVDNTRNTVTASLIHINLFNIDQAVIDYNLPKSYIAQSELQLAAERAFYSALYLSYQDQSTSPHNTSLNVPEPTTKGRLQMNIEFSEVPLNPTIAAVEQEKHSSTLFPTTQEGIISLIFSSSKVTEQTIPILGAITKHLQYLTGPQYTVKSTFELLKDTCVLILAKLRADQLNNATISTNLSCVNRYFYSDDKTTKNCLVLPTITTSTQIALTSLAAHCVPQLIRAAIKSCYKTKSAGGKAVLNLLENDTMMTIFIQMLSFALSDFSQAPTRSQLFTYDNVLDSDMVISNIFVMNYLTDLPKYENEAQVLDNREKQRTFVDLIATTPTDVTKQDTPYYNARLVELNSIYNNNLYTSTQNNTLPHFLSSLLLDSYRTTSSTITIELSNLFTKIKRLEQTTASFNETDQFLLNEENNTNIEAIPSKFTLHMDYIFNSLNKTQLSTQVSTVTIPEQIASLATEFIHVNKPHSSAAAKNALLLDSSAIDESISKNTLNNNFTTRLQQINDEFAHIIHNFESMQTKYIKTVSKSGSHLSTPTKPHQLKNSTLQDDLDVDGFLEKYHFSTNPNVNDMAKLTQKLSDTSKLDEAYFRGVKEDVRKIQMDCGNISIQLEIKLDYLTEISIKSYDFSQYLVQYFVLLNDSYDTYAAYYEKITTKQHLLRAKLARIQELVIQHTNNAKGDFSSDAHNISQQFLPRDLYQHLNTINQSIDQLSEEIAQHKAVEDELIKQQQRLFGVGIRPISASVVQTLGDNSFLNITGINNEPQQSLSGKLNTIITDIVKIYSTLNSYFVRLKTVSNSPTFA